METREERKRRGQREKEERKERDRYKRQTEKRRKKVDRERERGTDRQTVVLLHFFLCASVFELGCVL
jgi:hypothetical protein